MLRTYFMDGPRVVQLALAATELGWAWVLGQRNSCTLCMPTYDGFRFFGDDDRWAAASLLVALTGLPGLVWRAAPLRMATLILHSILWGYLTHLFSLAPAPVTGMAIYPVLVLLSWWGIWRLSQD